MRNTYTGISAAYDYLGNQLVYTDHYRCDEERYLLVADIPRRGTTTLYSLWGNAFNYACMAALLMFCMLAAKRARY